MEQHYKLFRVRELAEGDQDFINILAQTFLEEVPADAQILKEAVENNNHLATYQTAHKMKPTLDMFELDAFEALLEVLDWGKHEKKGVNIIPKLQIVLAGVEQASNEIRSDFNL